MKKEEFPTFLNEQPTIIFGRTGRELLMIVCGLFLGYKVWDDITTLLPDFVGMFLGVLLASIVIIAFFVLALVKIGYRHLEEWIFAWFLFIAIPKVYLYKPSEDDVEYQMDVEGSKGQQVMLLRGSHLDDLEED